jgi:hypothetical protein
MKPYTHTSIGMIVDKYDKKTVKNPYREIPEERSNEKEYDFPDVKSLKKMLFSIKDWDYISDKYDDYYLETEINSVKFKWIIDKKQIDCFKHIENDKLEHIYSFSLTWLEKHKLNKMWKRLKKEKTKQKRSKEKSFREKEEQEKFQLLRNELKK